MPSLDQVLAPQASEQAAPLVEGELVLRGARGAYLRVNGSAALWGPLRGAEDLADGVDVLVGVSQAGTYWVVSHG
jgi:hypothetical protein